MILQRCVCVRSFDSSRIKQFLRESARLYILYMSVGVSAIPAGIIYGILTVNGYSRWWVALLSIAFGLGFGRMTWKYVDSKLFWLRPTFGAFPASKTAIMDGFI